MIFLENLNNLIHYKNKTFVKAHLSKTEELAFKNMLLKRDWNKLSILKSKSGKNYIFKVGDFIVGQMDSKDIDLQFCNDFIEYLSDELFNKKSVNLNKNLEKKKIDLYYKNNKKFVDDYYKNDLLTFQLAKPSDLFRYKILLHHSIYSRGKEVVRGSEYYLGSLNNQIVYIRISDHWGDFSTFDFNSETGEKDENKNVWKLMKGDEDISKRVKEKVIGVIPLEATN